MSDAAIDAVLVKAYADGAFVLPTAYPGKTYKPTVGTPWAQLWILNVNVDQRLQTADKNRKILQIDLNYPLDDGTAAINAKSDALCAYFRPFRVFVNSGQTASVRSREPSSIRDADVWQTKSVRIVFDAVTDRAFG